VTPSPDDLDDLIDAAEVAEILGLSHRNSVSTYRRRYPDFPSGQPAPGGGRTRVWQRSEILAWRRRFTGGRPSAGPGAEASPRLNDLVTATARLLLAHPGADISIRQIAAEAGVAHSDLYRYAESKEQLVRLAVARVVDDFRVRLPEEYEDLLAGMEDIYRAVMDRAPAVRLIVAEAVSHPQASPATRIAPADIAQAIAAHRQRTGADSPVSPEVVAACLGAMVIGLVVLEARWGRALEIDAIPADQVAHVMRAVMRT
jgi:AcrR family transcriptional regulator/predicted DNA-binding transcriptional regulator AlpA